jgi:hypothetical protein
VIPAQYWSLEAGTGQLIVHGDCPISGELATRDTFDRAASDALRYRSRLDDVLVHVNGEKSNALAIERMVLARAGTAVDQFVVAGSGRRRPACLVLWKHESPSAEDRVALSRAIDETNKELPRHSQLQHELVLSLSASRTRPHPTQSEENGDPESCRRSLPQRSGPTLLPCGGVVEPVARIRES